MAKVSWPLSFLSCSLLFFSALVHGKLLCLHGNYCAADMLICQDIFCFHDEKRSMPAFCARLHLAQVKNTRRHFQLICTRMIYNLSSSKLALVFILLWRWAWDFFLALVLCCKSHLRLFGVILKEMCLCVTQSCFEHCVLIWVMLITGARKLTSVHNKGVEILIYAC